ncbi:Bug family tripartite tricarboxylate transporter substrate binding protein [Bordetella genomosp. 4]|uniref:Twin-arginine translocation pathway signal protein n=1 Tax=Bordetella genomosp. 4 TaxID=463044 RepID=A0A261TYL7_9BORD|nr:tripartite tricarboxylate transporter substrate binding protein [Bordetella genomosp. 4]OZI49319.1 twin-arginine translocation pathway signal protein [Bordetella genomosp. 4]OZI54776.1 twin-arginine translocation pathway signal protein [Bordetella genomosp. 4]
MRISRLLISTLFAVSCSTAASQSYPERAVRLIVPFGAGGITDIVARQVGKELGDALGQGVIIENRPGAGGVIGAQLAATSAPDGYTLFLGTVGTQIVNPLVRDKISYDPDRDFQPVGLVSSSPFMLAVHPSVQAQDFAQFVTYAKAHPGQLNFGSAGNASSPHLGLELLKLTSGVDITHVPFKSGIEAVNAAMGGQVDVVMDAIPVIMPQVQAGKLRALVLANPSPLPSAPGVPTSVDVHVPQLQISSWNGLYVPAGTPAPIVATLNTALQKALSSPALSERLASQGTQMYKGTNEEYQQFITAEKAKWTDIIQRAHIRLD